MVIQSANRLAEVLRDLGLIEPERLPELLRLAGAHPAPREFARELLHAGIVTSFQLQQVIKGKGHRLLLGPYVLLERIGAGGMGEVFKAQHRRLGRVAAVKVINKQRLEHPSAVHRFQRETEAAAQLSHPNIVAVHDADDAGDLHYLVMEYIDGIDLFRLLAKVGPLPWALACEVVAQAALGLHHAHELGYVHRDIKPQNILVAPRGGLTKLNGALAFERFVGATVKVLDMGLIRLQPHRLEDTQLALTQHGIVIGTMDYLPPEQARNAHRVDRRADLYSLGCSLYHVLTGRAPYAHATSPIDKLLRHQTEVAVAVRRRRPDVPVELEAVIERLMAKQAEDRYADAAELAAVLTPWANRPLSPVELVAVQSPGPAGVSVTLGPTQAFETPCNLEQETTAATEPVPLIHLAVTNSRRVHRKIGPSKLVRRQPERPRRWWWWVAGGVAVLVALGTLVAVTAVRASKPARRASVQNGAAGVSLSATPEDALPCPRSVPLPTC